MTQRARAVAFVAVAVIVTLGAGAWVAVAASRASTRADRPSTVAVADVTTIAGGPRIVFRNTEVGRRYGVVSLVSLADPAGPRAFTPVVCDRVYAAADGAMCLSTARGIATTFEARQLDADWGVVRTWPLPGIPSRTRLSADGTLLATTSFVTGHSYMQVGFSTSTQIRGSDGHDHGDLETFTLVVDGKTVNPVDRNVWGVTFGADDETFYATVATGGEALLVRGSLADRTLTAVRRGVECPSLSPDGTRIAFKHDVGGATPHWQIVVLDLATGRDVTLAGETGSVDDQVEWLGDSVLYAMPRANEPGVSDIWRIAAEAGATPSMFIPQASSPSVVDP